MSCIRFEYKDIENIRVVGKRNERIEYKAAYYGVGCTNVETVNSIITYEIRFTPILEGENKSLFHCDIYDNGNPLIQKGAALSAKQQYERENFVKLWKPYKDDGSADFTKEIIKA